MIKQSRWNYFDIILLQHSLKLIIVHQEENQFKLAFYLKKNSSENTVNKNTWMCFTFVYFVKYVLQNYRAYSFCGTIEYMAPEVVEGGSSGHDFVSTFLFYMYSVEDWWTFVVA